MHGDMTETVYLQQPQGFIDHDQSDKVCLLRKAIYGLKQGSRSWNIKLDKAFKQLNLKQSRFDSCIYSFYSSTKLIIVAIFVDDLIVFSNSIDYLKILKKGLQKVCTLKDLGPLRRCLGINVHRNRAKGIIELDQSDYIDSLLAKFGMEECRSVSTPMDMKSSSNGSPSQSNFNLDSIPYQNAVGSLLYLVQATRPDLAYALSTISQFNQNFDESHWAMVKRVLRYVQGTKDLRLRYASNGDCRLTCYCDASHAC